MSGNSFDFSVIIPANNEEAYMARCLSSLLAQDKRAGRLQIIVSANACTDGTEEIVTKFFPKIQARGWELICESSPESGKAEALNRADKLVKAPLRVYLDADIRCEPALFGQVRSVLDRAEPTYATGTIAVETARSWMTRAYAAVWTQLPFVKGGAVGAGMYAVNAAGRARWDVFPPIIADDMFARLNFTPMERIEVPGRYHWPMVEGFRNLVRVRRRQHTGVAEIYRLYPALRVNEAKPRLRAGEAMRLALSMPASFAVYALVYLTVRLIPATKNWDRGR